jgi:hypothetical protein
MIKTWKQFNESNSDYIKRNITEEEMNVINSESALQKLIMDENDNPVTGLKVISKDEIQFSKNVEDIINQYLN